MKTKYILYFLILLNFPSTYAQIVSEKKVQCKIFGCCEPEKNAKDSIYADFELFRIKKLEGYIEYDTIINGTYYLIKNKQSVYILEFVLNDQIYPVLVQKTKVKGLKKMKIGDTYKILLICYFSKDYFPGDKLENIKIGKLYVDHVRISGYNLYTTPNLIGLYYKP